MIAPPCVASLLGDLQPFAQIERIAPRAATVVIHGETGTGKELVADALHSLSPRRDRPFVVVDCGLVPRNLIESELFGHMCGAFTGATGDRQGALGLADGDTLFLDEIGELDPALQPKFLRALETGTFRPLGSERTHTVDVRVVAASHRDLLAEVDAGRFRRDLYFRLAVVRARPQLAGHAGAQAGRARPRLKCFGSRAAPRGTRFAAGERSGTTRTRSAAGSAAT